MEARAKRDMDMAKIRVSGETTYIVPVAEDKNSTLEIEYFSGG